MGTGYYVGVRIVALHLPDSGGGGGAWSYRGVEL